MLGYADTDGMIWEPVVIPPVAVMAPEVPNVPATTVFTYRLLKYEVVEPRSYSEEVAGII